MWTEWHQKLDFVESDLAQTQARTNSLEMEKKNFLKEIGELKKENRTVSTELISKNSEIQILQTKYEEMVGKLELERKEVDLKNKQVLDGMQNEIDFFKKELVRVSKSDEALKMRR